MARHVIDDSPEGLALLLGRDHGEASAGAPAPDDGDELPEGMHEAAADLIDAVHAKDHVGVARALHNAHSLSAAHDSKKE